MKFPHWLSLQKHLDTLKTPPHFYLVLHSQREERRRLLEKIAARLSSHADSPPHFLEGEDWDVLFSLLATPSLFSEKEIFVWMVSKPLTTEVIDRVKRYLSNPVRSSFLLIGAESSKAVQGLESNSLVVLDATQEKPWEKDKRREQELLSLLHKEGKTLSPQALDRLLMTGEEMQGLESELSKLLLYVGDKKNIDLKDVEAISSPCQQETGWKLAEALLWGSRPVLEEGDLTFLLAFLGQVRFLLMQSRLVAYHLKEGKGKEEIAKELSLRPTQVQKILEHLRSFSVSYLECCLDTLYEVELLAKDSSLTPAFLLHLIHIRFLHHRRHYARSTAFTP